MVSEKTRFDLFPLKVLLTISIFGRWYLTPQIPEPFKNYVEVGFNFVIAGVE